MNEQTLLTKMGFATHKAIASSVEVDTHAETRKGVCANCAQPLSAFWLDDEDRLSGWSSWKSPTGSTCK